jgi:NADH:ubiquinone oxidoreductase subunit 4 (subunit M)
MAEAGILLILVMVTARVGEVDLSRHHGLHDEMPVLSVMGLVLVLGAAGLPGSLDFVAEELLLSGNASHHLPGTLLLVGVIASVGFNLMRLQFRVFYGPSQQLPMFGGARPMFDVMRRERLALLLVVGALTAGGLLPALLPLVGRGMG